MLALHVVLVSLTELLAATVSTEDETKKSVYETTELKAEKNPTIISRTLSCPSPWLPLATGCYLLLDSPTNWVDGRARCHQEGASLVEIETQEEQDALAEEVLKRNGTHYGFWIGLVDREGKGVWKWESGKELNFTDWGPDQPSNFLGHDCGSLWLGLSGDKKGQWDDRRCSLSMAGSLLYGAVCEFTSTTITTGVPPKIMAPGPGPGHTSSK